MPQTLKNMHIYPKMASRLEKNLRLKALGYLLFVLAIFLYLLFGCPMANFWLLSSKQYHFPNVNHCIWAISFWPRAGMRGVGSLYLTECPVSFDHNVITPQIAENSLTLWWPLGLQIPPWMQNKGFKTLPFC